MQGHTDKKKLVHFHLKSAQIIIVVYCRRVWLKGECMSLINFFQGIRFLLASNNYSRNVRVLINLHFLLTSTYLRGALVVGGLWVQTGPLQGDVFSRGNKSVVKYNLALSETSKGNDNKSICSDLKSTRTKEAMETKLGFLFMQ